MGEGRPALISPLDNLEDKVQSFLLIARGAQSMAGKSSDLVQGTLEMLILKTLALDAMPPWFM